MNAALTTAAESTHMGVIAAQIRQHCNDAEAADHVGGGGAAAFDTAIKRMWNAREQAPLCDVTNARDALIAAVLLREQAIAAIEMEPAPDDVAARVLAIERFSGNLIRGLEQMSGLKAADLLPWFAPVSDEPRA